MKYFANISDSGLVLESFWGDQTPEKEGNWIEHEYMHVFRGCTYDSDLKVFYPPEMFPSWTLDKNTQMWQAPIAEPTDGKLYIWNEENQSWDLITE